MTLEQVQAAFLIVFVLLLAVGASTTAARVIDLYRRKVARPVLLGRDLVLIVGLAWPFAAILLIRAGGPAASDLVRGQLWWTLLTSIPPIVAVAVYDWFELRVIGRRNR